MKRLFLIISFLTLLVSCDIIIYTGNNNNEAPSIEEKPTEALFQKDDLYGTWKITKAKYAEDATMTEWEYEDTYATFKENGLYEGRGHLGNGEGTYSVSGNTITTFISNAPYITYEVISLTGAEAEIKATVIHTSQKIWILCTKVELVDTTPDEETNDETNDETTDNTPTEIDNTLNQVKQITAAAYDYLKNYMLYHHYIEYNALINDRTELNPNSNLIYTAYANGYKVISLINNTLRPLELKANEDWGAAYIAHLRTIRAFVYYNMVTLWGDIPYWTENNDFETVPRLPQTKAYNIINAEISSLNNISFNPEILDYGNSAFGTATTKLLLVEMHLYIKDHLKARELLSEINDETNSFSISLQDPALGNDRNFKKYKDFICTDSGTSLTIYTNKTPVLFYAEANNELDELPALWKANTSAQYGYWPMLNRIEKAKETVGCNEYETLMPIPESETIYNPNISQNPGY